MLDHRVELFTEGSATEPFSQSEIEARARTAALDAAETVPDFNAVPLDELLIEDSHYQEGIRILFRSHGDLVGARAVAPAGESCQWIRLTDGVQEHRVLAVTQTSRDTKVALRIPGEVRDRLVRPCELYYDPSSDRVIFYNRSDIPVELENITQASSPSPRLVINPIFTGSLQPGVWRMHVRGDAVLDFRILQKVSYTAYLERPALVEQASTASSTDLIVSSTKRSLTPENDSKRARRRVNETEDEADDKLVMFARPSTEPPPSRESRELAAINSHALLDARAGETVEITGADEEDNYQLTKLDPIASTGLSAVYRARHSDVSDNVIAVKVLKTKPFAPAIDKPGHERAHERNIIRQAESWHRETQSMLRTQEEPGNPSIVKFYGGDARFLSIWMEYVEGATDLTAPKWRAKGSDLFTGTREDAFRVLRDISSALSHIHYRKLVHNDIKPGNILYSRDRGAVVCDFGLSTPVNNSPTGGGTPYYLPPEFIGAKARGPASDVWALGVTMLYLLKKIPFPDGRGRKHHPRPLYWQIAGVNNPSARERMGNGQPAIDQMREWLMEIYAAKDELLNRDDLLERTVRDMLTPQPSKRITMAAVAQALAGEALVH
ncbi:protein kinase domain-containing protein [Sarocladium implicatum]|nr:protein kinase domain-containing protein [Sarocladium implicatum]